MHTKFPLNVDVRLQLTNIVQARIMGHLSVHQNDMLTFYKSRIEAANSIKASQVNADPPLRDT